MSDAPLEPLDYEQKGRGSARLKGWHVRLLVFLSLAICVLAVGWLLNPQIGSREQSPRVKCASNLRQIGLAIQMYANENKGQPPPDLGTVLVTQDLTSEVFVCPSSADERAGGPTTQAILQDLAKPGHCSYILASPLPGNWSAVTPDHVVVYEPLNNHGSAQNGGANVLFGDGHAEWMPKVQVDYLVAELKAGYNPPRKPK
jgi:prepilin-type processing-associated H-X9-DG protein